VVLPKLVRVPHRPAGGRPRALVIACGMALLAVAVPMAMAMGSGSPARSTLSVPSSAQRGKVQLRLADTPSATATLTDTGSETPTATETLTDPDTETPTATATPTE